jgi:hypothetical protein
MPRLSNVILTFDKAARRPRDCKLVRAEVHAVNPEISVMVIEGEELRQFIEDNSKRWEFGPERWANVSAAAKRAWQQSPERRKALSERMLKLWEARRAGRARPPRHQPVRTKS